MRKRMVMSKGEDVYGLLHNKNILFSEGGRIGRGKGKYAEKK